MKLTKLSKFALVGAALAVVQGCQSGAVETVSSNTVVLGYASDASTMRPKVKAGSLADRVVQHAAEHGVPAKLALAVVRIESNFDQSATGRAGEVGLMQIKHATARSMGYSGTRSALYQPDNNLRYGMKYLAKAYQMAGRDLCGTILRYNAGHYAKRMNKRSAAYCAKVRGMM